MLSHTVNRVNLLSIANIDKKKSFSKFGPQTVDMMDIAGCVVIVLHWSLFEAMTDQIRSIC